MEENEINPFSGVINKPSRDLYKLRVPPTVPVKISDLPKGPSGKGREEEEFSESESDSGDFIGTLPKRARYQTH